MSHSRNSQYVPYAKQERTTDSQKRGVHAARPNLKESAKPRSLRCCEYTRKADRKPVPLQQVWQAKVHEVPASNICYVAGAKRDCVVLLVHNSVCVHK